MYYRKQKEDFSFYIRIAIQKIKLVDVHNFPSLVYAS